MRRPDHREDHSHNTSLLTTWLPIVTAIAIMVTGCLSTLLVLEMDEFQPKIGDIVVFKPGSQDTDMWQMSIQATMLPANSAPATDCSLDPNAMATGGGSLVVEGREGEPSLLYRVHWSGDRTSKGSDNCGSAIDLAMARSDLQRLANAAGGFGVGEKGITR
jgi:hypothetical protein